MENNLELHNLEKRYVAQKADMDRLFELWIELEHERNYAASAAQDSYTLAVDRLRNFEEYARAIRRP
jgi:hypothetical protein